MCKTFLIIITSIAVVSIQLNSHISLQVFCYATGTFQTYLYTLGASQSVRVSNVLSTVQTCQMLPGDKITKAAGLWHHWRSKRQVTNEQYVCFSRQVRIKTAVTIPLVWKKISFNSLLYFIFNSFRSNNQSYLEHYYCLHKSVKCFNAPLLWLPLLLKKKSHEHKEQSLGTMLFNQGSENDLCRKRCQKSQSFSKAPDIYMHLGKIWTGGQSSQDLLWWSRI